MSKHQVTIQGRVHRVDQRPTKQGSDLSIFTLSVYAGGSKEKGYKPSYWLDCISFEINPPQEGSQIVCAGRFDCDEWVDKATGETRHKHKLIVDEWHPHVRQQQGYGAQQHPPTTSYQNQDDVPF